jgi:hypothetical protein
LHGKRPIKAVATLSPANFGTAPLQAAVPHLCLYGTWDGDLYEGQGPDIWSRGTRSAPRELVEVYGANHYFFTDKITFTPESQAISRQAHHLLAKGMVNAWLDRYLRGNERFDWAQYLTGDMRLGKGLEYYPSFQDALYLPIEDSIAILPSSNSSTGLGGGIVPGGLKELRPVDLSGKPDFGAGIALRAAWDTRKDALEFSFPPMDASAFACLSFRMSQVHGDVLNTVDFRKDFHVVVTDAAGGEAKVRVGEYLNGLQYPDLSGSLKPDDPNNRKQIMRGFRIPKEDLKGVDFSQVVAVKLVFDRPRTKGFDNISGTVKVADLEFATAASFLVDQIAVRQAFSPADPGMNVVVEVNSATGFVGGIDPNAGIEPELPNDFPIDDPQEEEEIPETPRALNVSGFEFVRLGPESVVGKAGDWALVLKGAGFYEAERAPIVHVGTDIALQDVYVNPKGEELYAVFPDSIAQYIQSVDIRRLSVQNPGGLNRDPGRWMGLDITHDDLVRACSSPRKAAFKRGNYFMWLEEY